MGCDRCHSPEAGRPFLIITSFFTRCLCHSLELCLSVVEGRDMRKMPDQTASIIWSPSGLHLPLGLGLPELAGQDADTGAMQPQVVNSNWYTCMDVTLEREGKGKTWWSASYSGRKGLSTISDKSMQPLVCSWMLYFLGPAADYTMYSINKDEV